VTASCREILQDIGAQLQGTGRHVLDQGVAQRVRQDQVAACWLVVGATPSACRLEARTTSGRTSLGS